MFNRVGNAPRGQTFPKARGGARRLTSAALLGCLGVLILW